MSDAAPGLQIDGWTLDRVLGEGGTAVVYAAHRTDDPSRGGALKLTRDTVTSVTAARIAHEARVLREATHPSLPTLEDAGTWQGRPYVVTGVVHGLSLELCVTWPPLSAPRSARLVLDLATVLQYLHARDVVHRDVKPANVRVTAEGRAVLLDFGAAVASDQTRLTVDGRAPATPSYAPPEWFDGRPVGPEGDLYALGVTLHELLTGDPAFDTVDPAQLRAAKQRGPLDGGTTDHGALSALVRRLTAPDPGARGPLAEAVATLERVAAPRGPVALPGTVGGLTTFFGEEAEEEEAAAFRQGPEVGDVLAGFRLVDRVGRGGMGEVWVAEQSRPRRRVALKTLHPERVSAFARGRFRFEAEALGQLLHPGIPQVYAAGEDRGRLFLAMELVDGHTLDQWVADGPSVADRVDLLAAICDAVHHAHLRGILHRDLKPANILVTDAGVPKVLDFGIAQALDGGSAGSRAGTPAYMSPEQFAGRPLDVRSDVYALGVVAFELLTGDRPGPAERLADRHPTLAGDLDAIVGTALAHDPDHRYASAQELAADLRRHRADVPVLARDPAWTYRVGRWLRRNALLAAAIAATTLGLGGVTTTSAWSAMTLSAAFQVEQRLRAEAEAARDAEAAQRLRADDQRAVAEAVTEFLGDVLTAGHPDRARGEDVSIREAVTEAAARVTDGAFANRPAVDALIRVKLANTFWALGDTDTEWALLRSAEEVASRAPPSEAVADMLLYMADQVRLSDADHALELVAQAEADLNTLDGVSPMLWATPDYVRGRIARADQRYEDAAAAFGRVLAVEGVAGTELHATAHNQRGHALLHSGELEAALAAFESALAIDSAEYGEDHPQNARNHQNVGVARVRLGDVDVGMAHLERAVEQHERFLGADHKRVESARIELCRGRLDAGRLEDARACAAALDGGEDYPGRVAFLNALIALEAGDPEVAEPAIRDELEARLARGDRTPRTLQLRGLLAEIALARGEVDAARAELAEVREALLAWVGPRSPYAFRVVAVWERLSGP